MPCCSCGPEVEAVGRVTEQHPGQKTQALLGKGENLCVCMPVLLHSTIKARTFLRSKDVLAGPNLKTDFKLFEG